MVFKKLVVMEEYTVAVLVQKIVLISIVSHTSESCKKVVLESRNEVLKHKLGTSR